MSACVSKSFCFSSPIKVEEDAPKVMEKQGIVSILGSDCQQTRAAASLRRTLSADMSSKKWLTQNGFSPMKRIASSEQLAIPAADSSSSSEGEEEYEGKELNRTEKELEKRGQFDLWTSILSQKAEDSSKLPPPYVHPLVKRSTSSLSGKSLEVCTESLGSETGSDVFSSYPPSETSDVDEDNEDVLQKQQQQESEPQSVDREELGVVKYSYSTGKKLPPRSFPPPLPSLTPSDGPSVHMHSHRENGRLVLEAVSVPSKNYFQAQRRDGRLLLTLLNSTSEEPTHEAMIDQEEHKVEEFEEVFDIFEEQEEENGRDKDDDDDDDDDEEEEEAEEEEEEEEEEEMDEEVEHEKNGAKDIGIVMQQAAKRGVINVHRSALMMKKLMGLDNTNPTWPYKFNKAVKLVEVEVEEEEQTTPLPQSLPPPPRVARLISSQPTATAASFNAYEYFWRTKPGMATVTKPLPQQCPPLKNNFNKVTMSNSPKAHDKQELVLLRGNKADYIVPFMRSCKEPRRSLLIWEPYCIATS